MATGPSVPLHASRNMIYVSFGVTSCELKINPTRDRMNTAITNFSDKHKLLSASEAKPITRQLLPKTRLGNFINNVTFNQANYVIWWIQLLQPSSVQPLYTHDVIKQAVASFSHSVAHYWLSGPSVRNQFSIWLTISDLRLLKRNGYSYGQEILQSLNTRSIILLWLLINSSTWTLTECS